MARTLESALGGRVKIPRGISRAAHCKETEIRKTKLLMLKRDKTFFLAFPKKRWNTGQFFV